MRFVVIDPDRALRADLLARMSKTSLTDVRDMDDVVRAGVAGKLDHIDQRRFIVAFRPVGSLDAL